MRFDVLLSPIVVVGIFFIGIATLGVIVIMIDSIVCCIVSMIGCDCRSRCQKRVKRTKKKKIIWIASTTNVMALFIWRKSFLDCVMWRGEGRGFFYRIRQLTKKCKTGVAASDKPFWFSTHFFSPMFIRALISPCIPTKRTKSNTFRSGDWFDSRWKSSFPCRVCQLLVLRVRHYWTEYAELGESVSVFVIVFDLNLPCRQS